MLRIPIRTFNALNKYFDQIASNFFSFFKKILKYPNTINLNNILYVQRIIMKELSSSSVPNLKYIRLDIKFCTSTCPTDLASDKPSMHSNHPARTDVLKRDFFVKSFFSPGNFVS